MIPASQTKKAFARLWMVKRIMKKGASVEDLTDISVKQTQRICEYGGTVWNSSITQDKVTEI